eukprot:scaffold157503_cov28-Tisochrysis_lutea.AAC.2
MAPCWQDAPARAAARGRSSAQTQCALPYTCLSRRVSPQSPLQTSLFPSLWWKEGREKGRGESEERRSVGAFWGTEPPMEDEKRVETLSGENKIKIELFLSISRSSAKK